MTSDRPLAWTKAAARALGALSAAGLLAGCITIIEPGAGPAVDASVQRGATYAQQNCSGCHSIGASGESVYRAAPAFRNLRAPWSPVALQLRLSKVVGREHYGMPPRILLPSEAEDLAAFIQNQRLPDPSKRMQLRVAPCIGLSWC